MIVLMWFLTFGYVPEMADVVNESYVIINQDSINTVAQFGLEASAGPVTFFTDMENYQYWGGKENTTTFYPYRIDYTIGVTIEATDWLSFTAEHTCIHPIVIDNVKGVEYNYGSSVTKFTATIRGSTTIGN